MAAPDSFAEPSVSSCTAGAVHTWPKAETRCGAAFRQVVGGKRNRFSLTSPYLPKGEGVKSSQVTQAPSIAANNRAQLHWLAAPSIASLASTTLPTCTAHALNAAA